MMGRYPAPRDDAMAAWMRDIKGRLSALAGRLVVPVGQRWRIEEDPEGNLVAVIPSTGHRILLGTPGGADCGALAACLPGVTADPLRYDAAAQRLMLALSGQPGNRLAVAEDGGLYGSGGASLVQGWVTASDPLTVEIGTISYPAERITEHTFDTGSRVWILVQDTTRLIVGTAAYRLPWHNGFDMGTDGATISRYNSERGITGDRAISPFTEGGPTVFSAANTDPISPLLSAYQPPFTLGAGAYPNGPDIGWSLQESDSGGSPIYDPHWAGQWAEIYATVTLDGALPSAGTWTLMRLYPAGRVWLTSAGQLWLEPAILGTGQEFNSSGNAIVVPSFTAVPGTTYRLRARFARTGEASLKVWTDLTGGAAPAAQVTTTIATGIELGNHDSGDDAAANFGLYGPRAVPTTPPFGSLTTSYTAPGVWWDEIGVDAEPYSAGDIPATLGDPALWYRADDISGADGDLVTSAPDYYDEHPLQPYAADPAYAPVLRSPGGGAHKHVEFVANRPLVIAPPADLGQTVRETVVSGGFTLFIVLASTAAFAGRTFLEMYDEPGGGPAILAVSDTHANLTTDGAAVILENHYPGGDNSGVLTLHEWRCDLTSWQYRRGGADITPADTTAPVTGIPAALTFSTASSPLKMGFSFTGAIYEAQMFSGALTGIPLAQARAYFASNYGLTV